MRIKNRASVQKLMMKRYGIARQPTVDNCKYAGYHDKNPAFAGREVKQAGNGKSATPFCEEGVNEMTSIHWEKVGSGRYASEYNGHVIQAIRKDGPHRPHERPYIAVVDRKPIDIGAWSLNQAKTQAIQHVERQLGKSKAESVFKNGGHKSAEPPMIPDPVDTLFIPRIEPEARPIPEAVQVVEMKIQPPPEPEPVAELDIGPPESIITEPEEPFPTLGFAGQLAITGQLNEGDLLDTLNALRSALELLREHAKLECTINLPPVLKL